MKVFIDNKEYNFSQEELDYWYLGEGNEGTAYIWKDKVLKIYKPFCSTDRLNEEEALYLSKIPTQRILLPIDLVYDENHKFIGYTTKFINNHNFEVIKNFPASRIKKELEIIREDIFLLSEKNVSLEDFRIDNFALEDGFYIIDPGTYKIVNQPKSRIFLENIKLFNKFFVEDILLRIRKFTKIQQNRVKEIFGDEYAADNIDSVDITISNYLGKIVK